MTNQAGKVADTVVVILLHTKQLIITCYNKTAVAPFIVLIKVKDLPVS